MSEEITSIFNKIKSIYKEYDLNLVSGGLVDSKGKSDVDISLYCEAYNTLHHVFKNSTATTYPDEKATIYSISGYDREVNIFATSDINRVNIAIKHRNNELKLNKYPLLVSAAITLKRLGESTESAWMKVLELNGDPYQIMARDDIEDIAKIQEERLKMIMNKL
ncbi:hypothetical protein K502DRAFT_343453 [Neoconidiobolus thromboides FSU 785]|nr:hypothetical protein K502DRAFT_343453 [Neoconidiobolus thromboides FSU 785]